MKFGIVFAENKKFNNLEIDAGLAFKKFLLVLLFVIIFLIFFGEYLGYKKIDFGINIFYYSAPITILLLFKSSHVIFDNNIIVLQSMSGIFKD